MTVVVARVYFLLVTVTLFCFVVVWRSITETRETAQDNEPAILQEVQFKQTSYVKERTVALKRERKLPPQPVVEPSAPGAPGAQDMPPRVSDTNVTIVPDMDVQAVPVPANQSLMDSYVDKLDTIAKVPNAEYRLKMIDTFKSEVEREMKDAPDKEFYYSILAEADSMKAEAAREHGSTDVKPVFPASSNE